LALKGKKILVTGVDGFIGSHLVEHRVSLRHVVRAFVLHNSFGSRARLDSASLDKEIGVVSGDIRDTAVSISTAKRTMSAHFCIAGQ
jgi:nucleoside-diphosphate-sugar epimerase